MVHRVCPPLIGYFLLNPLRKLWENPFSIFGGFVAEGMIVLEPGCGMGFFTLPLAEMVGPAGKVLAADIQPKMLSVLHRRVQKAGLAPRVEIRKAEARTLGVDDYAGRVDFVGAIHVVHEMPGADGFFKESWRLVKQGGKVLVIEPKGHVTAREFMQVLAAAEGAGFKVDDGYGDPADRKALLVKA